MTQRTKNQKGLKTLSQSKGFTIIEVLIVLAIAGLILLIVFLAVPALQRNSRNTQRRSDVSKILAAVQEYVNNNNGTLPASGTLTAFTNVQPSLGIYLPANVTWTNQAAATVVADPANIANITIANNATCNATGTASQTAGASTRSIVVMWDLESSAGTTAGAPQCTAS